MFDIPPIEQIVARLDFTDLADVSFILEANALAMDNPDTGTFNIRLDRKQAVALHDLCMAGNGAITQEAKAQGLIS